MISLSNLVRCLQESVLNADFNPLVPGYSPAAISWSRGCHGVCQMSCVHPMIASFSRKLIASDSENCDRNTSPVPRNTGDKGEERLVKCSKVCPFQDYAY